MGSNIIVSNDYIEVANAGITAQSTATGFAKVNVMDFWHLKRRWRMDSLDKSNTNPILRFDLGAATSLIAVVLNDVNFNKCIILGHASDLGTDWTAASFSSGIVNISNDAQVNRYKLYVGLTSFNYRYLAIAVPTTASAVGAYVTKWEVGTVVPLDSVNTFSVNMSYGYQRGATKKYKSLSLASGHEERAELGDMAWEGTLAFNHRRLTYESDLTTFNNLNIAEPLIFYENDNDSSKVYLCLRDTDYLGTVESYNTIVGNSIRLREIV